mmetsp:Transcript_391/g.909  ORF Transcript_391/g.909 Transcript_391/m.909 type:complete len:218 (+) Transcript_391:269-922(+)
MSKREDSTGDSVSLISSISACISSSLAATPRMLRSTLRASSSWPFSRRRRGLSGKRNKKPKNWMMEGTPAIPSMYRQPCGTLLSAPAMTHATNWPPVMKRLLHVTSVPRYFGGAASATYMGTAMEARPMPMPTTKRPTVRSHQLGAAAMPPAPMVNSREARMIVRLRPRDFIMMPPPKAPTIAPATANDTMSCLRRSSCTLKSSEMRSSAPEMTPVS